MKSAGPWRVRFVLFILLVSGVMLGCTYNRVQLDGGRTFSVERISSVPIYVSWVNAEEKDDGMVIRGILRTNSSHTDGSGHVDVAVLSPGGELLGQTSTDYAPKAFRKYRREARFETRFPFVPPDGSRIRVALHQRQGLEKGSADCSNNRAVKEDAA